DADFVATSAGWGVAKPDPGFFDRIIDAAGQPASAIAYIGDRLDNDVGPARAAGMRAIRLRRGPWAMLEATPLPPDVPSIDS
ncbi:HAD family hydrolase, partial [Vibrio parahaemolyticus]